MTRESLRYIVHLSISSALPRQLGLTRLRLLPRTCLTCLSIDRHFISKPHCCLSDSTPRQELCLGLDSRIHRPYRYPFGVAKRPRPSLSGFVSRPRRQATCDSIILKSLLSSFQGLAAFENFCKASCRRSDSNYPTPTMLVLEHSRHQQFVDQVYDLEQSIQAPYPSLAMDSYETVDPMISFHPLPYSYFENPSIFSTAPVQIKQEMHQMHDLSRSAVSSASAPSIPSASSSTVGSPYSGPSHTIASQDGFDHHAVTYGLGVMPTIVNHEAFPQEFGISMESELPIHSHEKLSNSFVGEYADLSSSQLRSSTIVFPISPSVHPAAFSPYQGAPLTPSPETLSINTSLERRIEAHPALPESIYSSTARSPTEASLPTPTFKSPTTPASARSRHAKTSFSQIKVGSLPSSTGTQTHPLRPSPFFSRDSHASQPSISRFQSHFFAQSSGNFIQPLETSCSSLLLFFPYFLYVLVVCGLSFSSQHPTQDI